MHMHVHVHLHGIGEIDALFARTKVRFFNICEPCPHPIFAAYLEDGVRASQHKLPVFVQGCEPNHFWLYLCCSSAGEINLFHSLHIPRKVYALLRYGLNRSFPLCSTTMIVEQYGGKCNGWRGCMYVQILGCYINEL